MLLRLCLVGSMMVPAVCSAEIVTFVCRLTGDLRPQLRFDTDKRLASFGENPWQQAIWGKDTITWGIISDGEVLGFMFQHNSGKLMISQLLSLHFEVAPRERALHQCTMQ